MKHGFLIAALAAAGATLAQADEIVLKNGHTIKDARAVDSRNPSKVVFDVGAGRIELDKEQVVAVNKGRTALDDYDEKAKTIQGSHKVGDYWGLVQWCRRNKLTRYVGPLCEEILKIDPQNEAAHKELGHEKLEGKWYTHDEAMEKKGFLMVGDRWMTKAEVELVEKRRLDAQQREMAAKAERERQKQDERDRRAREMEEYADWYMRQVSSLDGYFYQPDWFWPAYFRPYPWAPYVRQQRRALYGSSYGDGAYFDMFRFIPNPFMKR